MNLSRTVPQSVSQNIARAKSLLKRDEPLRALEALQDGLNAFEPAKMLGKARYEVEVALIECVQEMNRQPRIRDFIQEVSRSPKAVVSYAPGQEDKLKAILPILHKVLTEADQGKEQQLVQAKEDRKKQLCDKGLEYLAAQDLPRAKATLRRYADEFGEEPGVFVQVGEWMMEANLQYEAVEFFEQSLALFPRESRAYAHASKCYIELQEYEKAEAVYLQAIKEFGRHPKTLTNLAKLYMMWNKKDKAFDAAQAALGLDKNNPEAQEIFDKFS